MSGLAAIAMHFNPQGFKAPRENFRRFRREFHGCPLFTCEVSFDGTFHLDCTWQIHATDANLMWQKEQIVNWMVERLPDAFDQVAWIDADMLFLNDQWAQQTSRLLEHFPVCQLYEAVNYLNSAGRVDRRIESLALVRMTGKPGHRQPGGAWAARRELLARHGVFAANIVGGGDSSWCDACQGDFAGYITTISPPGLNAMFEQWARGLFDDVRGQIACTPGDLVHLYHGTFANRQYNARQQMLLKARYDPATDIRVGWNGLLEWASDKPDLHTAMTEYFAARQEDQLSPTIQGG